jgi:Winged helix-turn helix
MARPAGGIDELTWAREQVASATTVEQLRQAQAILLPLELGISLEQTALVIGRSVSMTCKLRNRRRRELAKEIEPKQRKSQLRNHAHASLEREAAALDQVLVKAVSGGVVVIPQLLPAMEKALGKSLNLSTLYRMLSRHGWRKIAHDTAHPQGEPQRREDFKKNSAPIWRKL